MYLLRRYDHEVSGIILDLSDTSDQIHLLRFEQLGLVKEFPPEVDNREDADHGVREEECRDGPVAGQEDGIATDESHDRCASASEIGDIRLKPAAIWQGFPGDPLGVESFLEADERESDDGEIDELGGSDLELGLIRCMGMKMGLGRGSYQIDKPVQHDCCAVGYLQETQETDDEHYTDTVDGNAVVGALGKEAWGFALNR